MAQSVFRPNQITAKEGEIMLKLTKEFSMPEEVEEVVEPEYTGPTADDLRREAEAFKKQWEEEKARMLADAQAQADQIVKNAEEAAFEQVKRQSDQASIIRNSAQEEAKSILDKARQEASEIIDKAHAQEQEITSQAEKAGYSSGSESGYADGKAESDRLVAEMHGIIDAVLQRRQEILDGTEQQIVDLVILMTRKVVKIMSDSQKSVILSNVVQALKKVKGRGDVTLRVNLADIKLTTEHTADFIREVENIQNIHIVEDSSVEKGGCIVETDFGAIDARISSQLGELETQILNIAPIKTVSKSDVINPDA
ncbi:flagellar assembly protein FliH [Treponema sp.]|uniref:flagellar assembly protein FliH n=1 Tax=Treponema sp. TaxID=166 RepID=UPI0025F411F3|nr:flagellar assembly protein FliH [Treponema sp.]MCR5217619.1 flagellar assembly protein FliH [Treponema sp.]